MIFLLRVFIFLFLLWAMPVYAHDKQDVNQKLGKISFPTSGSAEAQKDFIKAVLLLHNFEFEEARYYFQKAEKSDPDFAMAYWGEAMTYNHPLWGEQDFNLGKKTLTRLGLTAATRLQKAPTQKEKGFIHAINLLYGNGNKRERDIAYLNAMSKLYFDFPKDDEIATFYSLALLGAAEGKRDFKLYMKAGKIADKIIAHNSQHPGALHYAIHAYDDPMHAALGLKAAKSYAKIASASAHALHMPSHIFLALGMWDDVIQSNKAAWETSYKNNPQADPKQFMIHEIHALQWLSYGYLQKKQYKKAYQLTKIMEKIVLGNPTSAMKWYYAVMRAAYISETHDWDTDLKEIDVREIELGARYSDAYANLLISLNSKEKNKSAIQKAITALNKLNETMPTQVPESETPVDYFTSITESGMVAARTIILESNALIRIHERKYKDAIEFLKQAAAMEDKLSLGYGPPIPVKPAHELLAETLVFDCQYDAAKIEYIKALKRTPNRLLLMQGLATLRKIKYYAAYR